MNFYEVFSQYYDAVFPLGKHQLSFINKWAGNVDKKILDVACGSGNYALALAEQGYDVTAVDLDEGMINKLKEKTKGADLSLQIYRADMKKMTDILEEEQFDLIFCIGNSLVHLITLQDQQEALNQMYSLLREKGILILQIINYDRILKYNIDHLPTIENREAGIEFVRKYDYDKDEHLIYFNTQLIVNKDGGLNRFNNSVPLYPLKVQELMKMLKSIGFNDFRLYGSFKGEEYTLESYATVVIAEK